jgi:Alkaline and neutral invertase
MKDDLPLSDSIALLNDLATPLGIRASRSSVANYAAIFARDAIMAGLAGLAIGDATVTAGLVRTLERLRDLQGPQGQIASNFRGEADGSFHVSFGTLAPRFDSATWFLVGVGAVCQHGSAAFADYRDAVTRVIALLDGIEYNGRHLLYVPAGGNWADEYPFDGYILYDQVLRAWGLRLLGTVANEPAWVAKAEAIGHTIAERYWPAGDWRYGGVRRFPVAAISPVRTDEHVDLAACALLALSDLVPDRTTGILDAMRDTFLKANALPPAFSPVIAEGDPDWEPLARYHLHGFRNRPHEYHNGGIWPVWLGWLALAFARHGRLADVAQLHALTAAQLSRQSHFDFEEYFHGVTGEALGTQGMAYTATGFVFLETARLNQVDLPWTR